MNSVSSKPGEAPNTREKVKLLRRKGGRSSSFLGIKKYDILGFYSMNSEYKFRDDLSQLRYLTLPPSPNVNFNLRMDPDRVIRKKFHTNELKLDPILKWIISHRQESITLKRFLGDFVTFRGVLSKLMCSPYENMEGWIICATKFQGVIYLCKYDTPEAIMNEESRTSRVKEMGDWGYRFEQCVLSEHPGGPPNLDEPTNQNEEFACVFQTTIGPYKLAYAAEMDGLKLRNPETNFTCIGDDAKRLKEMIECKEAEFVELKTSADPRRNMKEWRKICRFKSNKWWAQCYTVDIKALLCGYRDEEGTVTWLDKIPVSKLPQYGVGSWDPNVCLQYLLDFLNLVKEKVSTGCDKQLWIFTWSPKEEPDSIKVELGDQDSPYFFLHKWATDELNSCKRKNEETLEGSSKSSKRKIN